METPIIVALTTSGLALVVAVIQLLNQNRQNAGIEKLRADLNRGNSLQVEYFKTLMSFQVEARSKRLQSIGNMIEVSQTIKDKMKLVADHPRSFPDRQLLNKDLTSLQDKVSQVFAANQISIEDKAWEIAHTLKNQCIAGLQLILDSEGTPAAGSSPPTETIERISILQNELRVVGRESLERRWASCPFGKILGFLRKKGTQSISICVTASDPPVILDPMLDSSGNSVR